MRVKFFQNKLYLQLFQDKNKRQNNNNDNLRLLQSVKSLTCCNFNALSPLFAGTVEEMGVDEIGVDDMGVDEIGSRRSGMIQVISR